MSPFPALLPAFAIIGFFDPGNSCWGRMKYRISFASISLKNKGIYPFLSVSQPFVFHHLRNFWKGASMKTTAPRGPVSRSSGGLKASFQNTHHKHIPKSHSAPSTLYEYEPEQWEECNTGSTWTDLQRNSTGSPVKETESYKCIHQRRYKGRNIEKQTVRKTDMREKNLEGGRGSEQRWAPYVICKHSREWGIGCDRQDQEK